MNGDTNFVCIEIVRINKAHIIGGDDRDTFLFRQRNGGMKIPLFVSAPGADEFQIEPVGKVLLVKIQALIDKRHISAQQALADIALARARKQD